MNILFVAMPHSIHTVRWIRQLCGSDIKVHLFPVPYQGRVRVHPELQDVTLHDGIFGRPIGCHRSLRIANLGARFNWLRLPRFLDNKLFKRNFEKVLPRAERLARTIEKLKPDIIHSLELLGCGYLTKTALDRMKCRPPWIVSNWGSELNYLAKRKDFHKKAVEVLAQCQFYTCECKRDVALAHDFGFAGEVLGVIPNAGGIDVEKARAMRQPGPTSARRLIALKGYHGWVGRALVALSAIEKCAEHLRGYQITIFAADDAVSERARVVEMKTRIPINVLPEAAHDEILRVHGQARVSIGLSMSDGISTSLLEAMAMGSFPIQSGTSCADEWVRCGQSGLIVSPEDVDEVECAIRLAIGDDELVDRAQVINDAVISDRLSYEKVAAAANAMYRRAAATGGVERRR